MGPRCLDIVQGGKTDLERILDSRSRMRSHVALHPYQRLHLRVQPIAHELKLPVRRDEADCAIILKPRQPHTLMEFHVLHLHRLAPRRASRRFEHDFIVEAKSEFGHPAEIAF